MRVLQINSVCGYGSTGNIAVDLYHTLKEQGHECCIAFGRGSAPETVESYRIGTDKDVYVHGILSRITDRHGFYSTKATKEFVKWMEAYNPDVIHLHNIHGYYINIEVLFKALKRLNKPVIWTLHDCWAFTGHCAYFDYAECNKWKAECEKCLQKRSYPTSFGCNNSKKNFRDKKQLFTDLEKLTIITPSEWLAKIVHRSFLGYYPVKVIYNGIDLDVFKPTESDFRVRNRLEDKKIILGVANVWDERKGLATFNELASKSDENYKIVIVGIDEKQKRKLNPKIIAIERTQSKRELAELYSCADVYLNPSYEETMGLTTVEALACGTSVLVRNKTALPEIVGYDKKKIFDEDLLKQLNGLTETECQQDKNREIALRYEKKEQYQKYIELYKSGLV